jgi:hypothetical protein
VVGQDKVEVPALQGGLELGAVRRPLELKVQARRSGLAPHKLMVLGIGLKVENSEGVSVHAGFRLV